MKNLTFSLSSKLKNILSLGNGPITLRLFAVACLLLTVSIGSALGATTATLTLSSSNKFGTSSGSTKNDNQGNTWTCTCSNIQNSYQNAYSGQQFGTGSTPADATFTCTIAGATISSVKATMATGADGTYTIKVGGVTKYSGSLTTTATEYGGTDATGSGEIEIKITKGTKASYLGQIVVVYTTSSTPHTITFNAGSGSCATSSSGSVTSYSLPSASPSASCASEGWAFAGWKESSAQSSASAPASKLWQAGETYSPAADITLYAVYFQASGNNYEYIDNLNSLFDGAKLIITGYYSSTLHAVSNTMDGDGYIYSSTVSPDGDDVISSPANSIVWTLNGYKDNWTLKNVGNNKYIIVSTRPALANASETFSITYEVDEDDYDQFNIKKGSKYLYMWSSDYTFSGYDKTYLYFYQQQGTFNTNPSCATCDDDPTIGAASQKGSITLSTQMTAQCSSGISNIGGEGCTISSYGFAVGTATGPTIGNTLTTGGATYEVGSTYTTKDVAFEKLITGLSASTKYYARAYATNGHGTGYGDEFSFTMPAACSAAPTVTAATTGTITSTTAVLNCSSGISALGTGGCAIESYGFVIGTASDPAIGGSGVTQHEVGTTYTTTGTSFTKTISSGLTEGTLYYVRPYATNGYSTGYGTQVSFGTPKITVSTTSVAFGDKGVDATTGYTATFTVEGVYLQSDISIAKSGTNEAMFTIDETSVSQTSGTAAETTITVTYKPSGTGSHSATLTLTSTNAIDKTVSLSGTGKWTVTFLDGDGEVHSTALVANGSAPSKPGSNPSACDATSTTFMGWTQTKWNGKISQDDVDDLTTAATKVYFSGDDLPTMSDDMTYYPVFAKRSGSETEKTINVTTDTLTSYTSVNKKIGGITFKSTDNWGATTWSTYTYLQCKKNSTFYNDDAFPGYIKSVTITRQPSGQYDGTISGTVSLCVGTTKQPSVTCESAVTSYDATTFNYTSVNNYTYLSFAVGSTAASLKSISITYAASSYTYSDYLTTCCENKVDAPTVTGTPTKNSITLNWTNVTGATGYTVTCSGGTPGDVASDGTARSCVITGLSPNTNYTWSVVATYTTPYCLANTANGNTTTSQVYAVSYNKNGGTIANLPSGGTYAAGEEVTVAAKPDGTVSKGGYTFTGWNTANDGSGEHYNADGSTSFTMPSEAVVLYAEWTAKKNYFIDRMHGNWDGEHTEPTTGYNCYLREGAGYTVPDLSDNDTGSNSCVSGHAHFIGWVVAGKIGAQGQLLSEYTVIKGGTVQTAGTDGTIYYAVWAEE